MSISISESTLSTSTNENGGGSQAQSEQWDRDSGVFPRSQRLRGKASSTVLGQRYVGDDGGTDTSNTSRWVRNEDSMSTLKSHYDRQKSPLSISQQTSASSARDLALRKGFPPVVTPPSTRSPLLGVQSTDPFNEGVRYPEDISKFSDKDKKKPAKLDLAMLFPGSRKNRKGPDASNTSTSIMTTASHNATSSRRKLSKAPSKEYLRSPKPSTHSVHSRDDRSGTEDSLYNLYGQYEQLPTSRNQHMSRISETHIPDYEGERNESGPRYPPDAMNSSPSRSRDGYKNSVTSPADQSGRTAFSWKNVRATMDSSAASAPARDSSSAASISSHRSKNSRNTNVSVLSNTDLRLKSVLSLSSDSEEESEPEFVKPPVKASKPPSKQQYNPPPQTQNNRKEVPPTSLRPSSVSKGNSSRKGAAKASPFLTIPETSSRFSGPWQATLTKPEEASKSSSTSKKHLKKSSVSSSKRSLQPTPPLSPKSLEFPEPLETGGRLMAVTKQEEALLEALRHKRANMREKIIEEHETKKSPHPIPKRTTSKVSQFSVQSNLSSESNLSAQSSTSTMRPGKPEKGNILLYLDPNAIERGQDVEPAEPSPDLSDFLSFGSDDDSTPTTRGGTRGKDRERFFGGEGGFSPLTPPNAARLSAVGPPLGALKGDRLAPPDGKKRNHNVGVRFMGEVKYVNPQDFILDDEGESEGIWGM